MRSRRSSRPAAVRQGGRIGTSVLVHWRAAGDSRPQPRSCSRSARSGRASRPQRRGGSRGIGRSVSRSVVRIRFLARVARARAVPGRGYRGRAHECVDGARAGLTLRLSGSADADRSARRAVSRHAPRLPHAPAYLAQAEARAAAARRNHRPGFRIVRRPDRRAVRAHRDLATRAKVSCLGLEDPPSSRDVLFSRLLAEPRASKDRLVDAL
jgi:hypothetical protein